MKSLRNESHRPTRMVRAPALGRTNPDEFCSIKKACGSCKYINDDYEKNLQLKQEKGLKLFADAGLLAHAKTFQPHPSPRRFGYRTIAKLAYRKQVSRSEAEATYALGLYAPGTHQIVDITSCPIHEPTLKAFLLELRNQLNESSVIPYCENALTGDLRYVLARINHVSKKIMVTFVATSRNCQSTFKGIIQKMRANGFNIHSGYLNIQTSTGNAILGKESILIAGAPKLPENLCGFSFYLSPESFFQVNPWQASLLYRRLEQIIGHAHSPETVALDLYSGIAPIAMLLARAGYKTLSIEENPLASCDAKENAQVNGFKEGSLSILNQKTEDALDQLPIWANNPKIIVVNPSRKGLNQGSAEKLRDMLSRLKDTQFCYISCNGETLSRDLSILAESGYKLRQIEAFDMFPHTDKLEWLAVLTH